MKVLYDITLLAQAQRYAQARTGLFRVVDNVARGLVGSSECDVSFCLAEGVKDSIDFLNEDSQLQHVNLALSRRARLTSQLYGKIGDLTDRLETTQTNLNAAPLKAARKILYHFAEFTGRYRRVVSDEDLTRADIYHSPFHPIPKQAKKVRTIKRILTVYDLIPILYPEYFGPEARRLMADIIGSVGIDDIVLCISQQTKTDLCNYRTDLDPERVFITHLAASELFHPCLDQTRRTEVRARYNIPEGVPYFLSLGTLERRKNVEQVIRCFSRVVREQGLKDLRLVLIGTKGLGYDRILEAIASLDMPEDCIILTGYVADADLAALYSSALAFVYLSFYEGFGLPPLEAMQCGTPIISSNTSSLPEVVGEAGILLDPEDEDGICQSLFDVYRDEGLRAELALRSLDRARQFSWDRCVKETIAAYKFALDS